MISVSHIKIKNTASEFTTKEVLLQQSAATIKPKELSEQRQVRLKHVAWCDFSIAWIKYFNFYTHKINKNFILTEAFKIQFFKFKASCQFFRLKKVPRQSCHTV